LLTGWVLVSPLARTIAALLAVRDHVIGPILAGVRSPRLGRKPTHWTAIDRDYETLRIAACRPSSPTSASPPAAPQLDNIC
jgi:hypothetical protein